MLFLNVRSLSKHVDDIVSDARIKKWHRIYGATDLSVTFY